MGKLVDRLNRAAERGGPAMGFGASGRAQRTLAVIARGPGAEAEAYARAGADAFLADDGKVPSAAGIAVGAAGRAAGADFVMIQPGDSAEVLLDEADRVLQLPADLDDQTLRTLSLLEIEAVAVAVPGSRLSVGDLAQLRRAMVAFGSPAAVILEGAPDATTLRLARDNGAAGVIVNVPASEIAGVISLVEGLPARPKPRRSGADGALITSR